ncbi:phage portal protein [Ochrobactrum sp. MR28]|nr:phage portal protein [Ochrobactrum sp. MR28]MBX8818775.1 phage portal protein [Ochrobactrum sp. MR31]
MKKAKHLKGKANGKKPDRASPKVASMRYLRGDRTGILNMRRAVTRDAKHDVREAADRAAALAIDFIHNSGWLAGAVTQVISDTVGEELKLNCRADLKKFGYSETKAAEWCRSVEKAWRKWAWNPKECDLAGKSTIAEMIDGALRSYLAYGEAFAVFDYLSAAQRAELGVTTGTKVSLVAPHRCPRVSRSVDGLEQGIFHNSYGRPTAYRFKALVNGLETDRDVAASNVAHVMDRGENLNSPRGISVIAPALKVMAQSDQLADATLATSLMQAMFAATITSPEPSETAFQAIQTLDDVDRPSGFDGSEDDWENYISDLKQDFLDVWGMRISALKDKGISMSDPARINHLGPGEQFQMHTANLPGSQYVAFTQNLHRETARCIGVTFGSFTMDHSNATYSSERMSVASIWPVVLRRRHRIPVRLIQEVYERWLEEMIEMDFIPFKGGKSAFRRDRESVYQAEWNGPPAPTADDYRSAMADKIELELGLTTYEDACAKRGKNGQEQIVQIGREIKEMAKSGLPHPFGRSQGGGAGPMGAAVEGNRDKSKAEI